MSDINNSGAKPVVPNSDSRGKCTSWRPPIMCPPHQCLSPCSCNGFARTEFDIQEYKRLVDSKYMPWVSPPQPMARKEAGF